jgi:hypothetical protein
MMRALLNQPRKMTSLKSDVRERQAAMLIVIVGLLCEGAIRSSCLKEQPQHAVFALKLNDFIGGWQLNH